MILHDRFVDNLGWISEGIVFSYRQHIADRAVWGTVCNSVRDFHD